MKNYRLSLSAALGVYFISSALPLFSQQIFPWSSEGTIQYEKIIKPEYKSREQMILLSGKIYDQIDHEPLTGTQDSFNSHGDFTRIVKFKVFQKSLVTQNPAGIVTGRPNMTIVTDSAVLKVADLKYTELKRDRYAQFKPAGIKPVPLEKMVKLHKSKSWQTKFIQLNDRINQFLDSAETILKSNIPPN